MVKGPEWDPHLYGNHPIWNSGSSDPEMVKDYGAQAIPSIYLIEVLYIQHEL